VGEMEETDGFVNDREAQGDKGVDAAYDNAVK
jgi:hypothetical protein